MLLAHNFLRTIFRGSFENMMTLPLSAVDIRPRGEGVESRGSRSTSRGSRNIYTGSRSLSMGRDGTPSAPPGEHSVTR